jgi:hypothetical protein
MSNMPNWLVPEGDRTIPTGAIWRQWIKTVSNTNGPLFYLSAIYIQKSLKRWKKYFFAVTEKISDLNSIYFHAKTILFWDYIFLAYFGLWSVIHSNRARYIFSWTMNVTSQGVIFTISQICAYFVDNPHNLEIDSFKIAVSEHILLYFKNSNSFFLRTHDNVVLCLFWVLVLFSSWCIWQIEHQDI